MIIIQLVDNRIISDSVKVSKEEIRHFMELQLISQITSVKDKLSFYQIKYKINFEKFEKLIKDEEENFEKWDDYIEWKAYMYKLNELNQNLVLLKNAEHFTIVD